MFLSTIELFFICNILFSPKSKRNTYNYEKGEGKSRVYQPFDQRILSWFLSDERNWFGLTIKLLHVGKFGGRGAISWISPSCITKFIPSDW